MLGRRPPRLSARLQGGGIGFGGFGVWGVWGLGFRVWRGTLHWASRIIRVYNGQNGSPVVFVVLAANGS